MDYSYTAIIELNTGRVVADILSNQIAPGELAYQSMQMLNKYTPPNASIRPLWAIEDNEWGIEVITAAREERYNHLYKRSRDQYGWHSDVKSRWAMWVEFIATVNAGQLILPNKEALGQLFTVILNADKGGRPEARNGANDDVPTALAIAFQMRKQVPTMGTGKIVSPGRMY